MSIKEIKSKIRPILNRHGVKTAAIFGSYARGEESKKSDIDILIEYRRDDKNLFDLAELKIDLEKKLSKKVDILTYGSIHPLLKDIILSEQKFIYEKK
jgi:hypothetical protein